MRGMREVQVLRYPKYLEKARRAYRELEGLLKRPA